MSFVFGFYRCQQGNFWLSLVDASLQPLLPLSHGVLPVCPYAFPCTSMSSHGFFLPVCLFLCLFSCCLTDTGHIRLKAHPTPV